MKRRVVVTGMGAVTPVGNDVATMWRSLIEGRSGAGPITRFDATDFQVRFACEVKGFDVSEIQETKTRRALEAWAMFY